MIWLLAIAALFLLTVIFGAPYVPTHKSAAETALDLLEVTAEETFLDLGSGDGTVLLVAAKRGINAVGVEINPILCAISWLRTLKYRKYVTIKCGSYWHVNLANYSAVYVFGVSSIMQRLRNKFAAQLKPGSRVASYAFEIDNSRLKVQKDGVNVYQY